MLEIIPKLNGHYKDIKTVVFRRVSRENRSGQETGSVDPVAGETGEEGAGSTSCDAQSHLPRVGARAGPI
jgi:hypothetical protein